MQIDVLQILLSVDYNSSIRIKHYSNTKAKTMINATEKTSITENEFQALYTCLNCFSSREDQKNDNFSNGGMAEFMSVLGWNSRQVAGLISSMEQKGFGEMEVSNERGDYQKHDIFWLSDHGIDTIFDVIEGKIETIK